MEATAGPEAVKISEEKGKAVETSGSPPAAGCEIPNQRGPGVVFILDNLPFDAEDDFPGTYPLLPNRIENLSATYQPPLKFILESPLNWAGMLQAVYVNFGRRGCFEIKPHADIFPSQNAFSNLLRVLFQTGRILKLGTNEVTWQKIHDIPSLVESLPANSRKIGCLTGTGHQDVIDFQTYLTAATNDKILVFVVGDFTNLEIAAYIDDYVKVSNFELSGDACVSRICVKCTEKWNLL